MNTPLVKLSAREYQVLQARSYGLTIEETGEWLTLSPNTIKSHMRRILKRTKLKGCAAVIFTYRKAGKLKGSSAQECHLSDLTSRELEVAELVCEGLTNKTIGRRLFLSEDTIKTHVSRILAKWKLRNRMQLASVFATFKC